MFDNVEVRLQNLLTAQTMSLLVSTGILLVVIFILRTVMNRVIRQSNVTPDVRRKWLIQTRNGLFFLFLMGMVMIWGEELRTLALSLVAIAVAFVVATKELILCITGSFIKTRSRSFSLGDRIQIKDYRGDVVDFSLLATTILEVGPGKSTQQRTGRMIVIPNSLLVSEPVINESYSSPYLLHVFSVPFKRDEDWRSARTAFLEAARRQCAPYLDQVRHHMNRLSELRGLDVPTVDPRVTIQVPEAGEVHLVIRLPVRAGQSGFTEQAILNEVFEKSDFMMPEKESGGEEEKEAGQK